MLPLQASVHEMLLSPTFVGVQVVDEAGEVAPVGFFGSISIHTTEGKQVSFFSFSFSLPHAGEVAPMGFFG
jgi:hypothetical protein